MGCLVVVAVLALPVAEVMVALRLAERLGWEKSLALGVGTMLAGITLARSLRRAALAGMRRAPDPGRLARAAFDAACGAAAEFLFFFPGVVSDALGALLLVPPVRALLAARLASRVLAGGGRGFRVVWRARPPGQDDGPARSGAAPP
ncbi:MAG: FxsA family protein, partial [Deltaproteobacteria bacterium]|nr:FxsA family protein [Deltaproteobacteria bacterium]